MAALIAFCGLDCSACEAYKATQADDLAWKERVVEQWKKEYGATNLDIKGVTCDGCTSLSGRWGAHCYECDIRLCGLQHGVSTCAACPEYVCEKLEAFFQFVPTARQTLDALR
jgi:hypothetical protein